MAKKKASNRSLAETCKDLFKAADIEIVKSATDEVLFKNNKATIRITRKNDRSTVVQEYEDGSKRLLYTEVMEKFTASESVEHASSRIKEALGM